MSSSPFPTSSEFEPPGRKPPLSPTSAGIEPSPPSSATALLTVLRDALTAGAHTPDEILLAIADTARTLTGANGAAIALRTDGVVVCRARSGDIAPELGAALNVESGISGECFRTSSVLRCDDTQNDCRVEPEVCRLLGIRSIAVVPLRDAVGTVGILEVFSSRAYAFSNEQIGLLKSLGEIAEAAYQRELDTASSQIAKASASLVSPGHAAQGRDEWLWPPTLKEIVPKTKNRYWIVSAAAVLLLLAALVVLRTWRQPVGQSASAQPTTEAQMAAHGTTGVTTPTLLPSATSVTNEQHEKSRPKDVVRNAASVEKVDNPSLERLPTTTVKNADGARTSEGSTLKSSTLKSSTGISGDESPPTIIVGIPENGERLANVISSTASLPALAPRVSEGVTEAAVIRKVMPTYPPEARSLRLEGSVTLDVSIAEDGTVGDVKLLHGEPLLAASAVAAVRQWRYSPTLLNGKPTSAHGRVTILFKLP
ncbi:MAG: TonB family protein [Candidatus Sulfotelmatobacter sp.]